MHLYNCIQDMVGRLTLSQPTRGKDTPKNDLKTAKTQLHPESSHKWHKGHYKSIRFRRTKTVSLNPMGILTQKVTP